MTSTSYIHNMFAAIKVGQVSKSSFVIVKRTKVCEAFAKILWDEGFINGYKFDLKNNKLKIFLKYYKNNRPVINSLKTISKPGRRVYYSNQQICKIDSNSSFILFSTNDGLKSIVHCKKYKLGGEPFITIN